MSLYSAMDMLLPSVFDPASTLPQWTAFTIIGFSNPVRRHSALGYRSPMRHEHERLTGPPPAG